MREADMAFDAKKPVIKECLMRVASLIIMEFIERFNDFGDDPNEEEKRSILVFLPGL